jgi:tRNA(fMet)-specific endonuclease VapC
LKRERDRVIVDTNIWIEFFKQKSLFGDRLETLILENSAWVCGIIIFELMQGIKSDTEKFKILGTLSDMHYIEMSKSLWLKSAELSMSLKKKGVNLPLSDIFIAAIALEYDLSIFTLDKHFNQIPGVKIYRA